MSSKKKKKEKITYIDDGRTIADMSGTSRMGAFGTRPSSTSGRGKKRSTFKEQRTPYFQAVKMMFIPMLCVIGLICVAFLFMWLFFEVV